MAVDNDLNNKSDAELEAERQKVAQELWEAKDPKDPRHQELEAKYNALEKERFTRQGNDPETYKNKHDARHEFQFEENQATGEKRATMAERPDGSGPYTLRKRDEVINWRDDTEVGAQKSRAAQRTAAGGSGDDAGHLVGAEFGADPADQRNITKQSLTQNERGAWYRQERQLREDVEQGRECGVDVSVKPYRDRSSRNMETFDVSADGKRSESQGGNVEYVDFSTKASRARQEGNPSSAEMRQARKDTHAHATEVDRAVKNQNPEEVRDWQRRKEDRGGPPARSATAASAPPSREEAPEKPDRGPDKGKSR